MGLVHVLRQHSGGLESTHRLRRPQIRKTARKGPDREGEGSPPPGTSDTEPSYSTFLALARLRRTSHIVMALSPPPRHARTTSACEFYVDRDMPTHPHSSRRTCTTDSPNHAQGRSRTWPERARSNRRQGQSRGLGFYCGLLSLWFRRGAASADRACGVARRAGSAAKQTLHWDRRAGHARARAKPLCEGLSLQRHLGSVLAVAAQRQRGRRRTGLEVDVAAWIKVTVLKNVRDVERNGKVVHARKLQRRQRHDR